MKQFEHSPVVRPLVGHVVVIIMVLILIVVGIRASILSVSALVESSQQKFNYTLNQELVRDSKYNKVSTFLVQKSMFGLFSLVGMK